MTIRKSLETAHLKECNQDNDGQIKCFPIPPMEFGGERTESLSSYLVRLCATHKLLPNDFLASTQFLRDCAGSAHPYRRTNLATVNGMGPVAQKVVARLSSLTGNKDLRYLTALPWADMLDPKGNHLLRKTRAWCPICYSERKRSGGSFFDSLYASFRIVSLCAKHLTPLQDKCPKCGSAQPFVPRLPFLEYCLKCGHDLSEPQDYSGLEHRSRARAEVWFASSVADLIKTTIHYHESVTFDAFSGKLSRILAAHAGGKTYVLAQQLGLSPYHLVNWLRKGFKPGFPLFLDLCRRINCPPSSFLFESDELTHPDLWNRDKPRSYVNRSPRSEREVNLLGALVNAIANSTADPPKSLKQTARELGCSPSYLACHFPEDVAKIRSRYHDYRYAELERRRAGREERIRLAFQTATSQGMSTSERSLKSNKLITPRDIRNSDFKRIKSEVLGQT